MGDANDWKNKGNDFFKNQDFNSAVECFTKAIELDSSNHIFFSNRSGAYANLGQYEQSLEDANTALKISPSHTNSISRKGHALLNLGKIEESIQAYESGLQIDPNHENIKKGLQDANNLLKAKSEPRGAGGSFPGASGFGQNQQQQMLMKLLSNPKTAKLFQDENFMKKFMDVQSNPGNITKYLNDPDVMTVLSVLSGAGGDGMGDIFGGNDSSETFPNFESQPQPDFKPEFVPKSDPTPPPKKQEKMAEEKPPVEPHIAEAESEKEKGNGFYKKGDLDNALKSYQRSVELDEYNLLYRSNIVAVLIMQKKFEEGLQVCDDAIKVHHEASFEKRNSKNLAKIHAKKARIFELQGKLDESLAEYDQALLNDNDGKIRLAQKDIKKQKQELEKKNYINPEISEQQRKIGNDLYKEGKFAQALEAYEEAIKRNPSDPTGYNNKSMCYIKLMEFNLAMSNVEKAIQLDPKYIKAWNRKATIHHALKEYHKALDAYNVSISIDPENSEAKDGLRKTQIAISNSMHDGDDEERRKRAMSDPEIQQIMNDPMLNIALKQMQQNPQSAQDYFMDPNMGPKLQKLIAAGILKVG